MTTAVDKKSPAQAIEQVLVQGNLGALTPEQRVTYYNRVCESLGLNPLTRPFEYLTLSGKLVLYARKDCTEQLRNIHGVSVTITARETTAECYVVTAKADVGGRQDESIGAVFIAGLKGDALANAMMKAETKAKRRVTLSICGMGILDESEVEHIPEVRMAERRELPAADERQEIINALGVAIKSAKAKKLMTDTDYGAMLNDFGASKTDELTTEQLAELTETIRTLQPAPAK